MVQYAPKKYVMKIGVTKEVLDLADRLIVKNGYKNRTDLLYFALMYFLKGEAHDEAVNNEAAMMNLKEKQRNGLE